ncbi:hypothetical protein [Amycolatopsis nigrescens]|uniref:hypothetical protein n=1 Tax=Amycolatopsis nigrescens TaxID=381445 RepID=UPI00039DBA14|nr:hypothetical protein [Amycolatopsis nigrescens]
MSHRRNRLAILVVLLSVLTGCTSAPAAPPAPPPSATGAPAAPQPEPSFLISYAAAAGRLDGLDPAEADEQLRDWARTGLAAQLEMDTARLRDASFDALPVRDTGLADVTRQPIGPGRALDDGNGVLHLLVPRGDPHRARTVGLLLDQHRADAGADPPKVQLHDYEILPGPRAISMTVGKPVPAAEVRAANGYVSMRVDGLGELTDFLAKTRHLAGLEVRGAETWAEGWNWPDVPAAAISVEDVSVLQRGYSATSGPLPGFSLDPGPDETVDDLRALVPGLSPATAEKVAAGGGSELRQGIVNALFGDEPPPAGLPADRTRLWALLQALDGRPAYSQARFDGPLAGTEVGMSLFYADIQAKNWANGVGDGVPAKAVPGFVPDPDAATPWGHCPEGDQSLSESGRLWFGQAESGFAFGTNRISMGAQATRLFAKSDGDAGAEVEPSYAASRGLAWWDKHFQAVSDFEPQYQRVDQIMRWSGALEWLVTKTGQRLPEPASPANPGLRFAEWYSQHQELKERSPIDFVTPPSATQEAVLAKPSKTFKDCGSTTITGGVSLGDLLTRRGDRNYQPELPPPVRRAGLIESSTLDPATRTGQIKDVSLDGAGKVESYRERTFSPLAEGKAAVETIASGRKEVSLGGLKVQDDASAARQVKNEFTAGAGIVEETVEVQGTVLGTLRAAKDRDSVDIAWQRGTVDRAVRLSKLMQERWGAEPTDGALLSYQKPGGGIQYQLDGPDGPWLVTARELSSPDGELTFRLGAPPAQGGRAEYTLGGPRGPPELGGPEQMLAITPRNGEHSARIEPTDTPASGARAVQVATLEGEPFPVSQRGEQWLVPRKELDRGTEFSAAFAKFNDLDQAMAAAKTAGDRYARAVSLDGSGVALVDKDKVTVVSNFHPWSTSVLNAIVPGHPAPLFAFAGKEIRYVGLEPVKADPGKQAEHSTLGQALGKGMDVFVHENARVLHGQSDGAFIADVLPRETAVTIVQATVETPAGTQRSVWQPDIRVYQDVQWQRVGVGGIPSGGGFFRGPGFGTVVTGPPPSTAATTTTAAANSPSAPVPAAGDRLAILLVCPDIDPALPGCGS